MCRAVIGVHAIVPRGPFLRTSRFARTLTIAAHRYVRVMTEIEARTVLASGTIAVSTQPGNWSPYTKADQIVFVFDAKVVKDKTIEDCAEAILVRGASRAYVLAFDLPDGVDEIDASGWGVVSVPTVAGTYAEVDVGGRVHRGPVTGIKSTTLAVFEMHDRKLVRLPA